MLEFLKKVVTKLKQDVLAIHLTTLFQLFFRQILIFILINRYINNIVP